VSRRAASPVPPAAAFEPLVADAIRRSLPQWAQGRLRRLEVHGTLASTSDRLLAIDDPPPGRFDACLAESQTAGRGRQGRRWLAPAGSGLCLSVNWAWRDAPGSLSALPLAAGVAVLRALAAHAIRGCALKWPNDVVYDGAKLGGILIDGRGEAGGPTGVVVGVGLNVRLPDELIDELRDAGQVATDLARVTGTTPARNALAASLIAELAIALEEYGVRGLPAFAAEWHAADALRGRPVSVSQGERSFAGIARGVDADGALLVELDGVRRRFHSGEVSVRAVG